MSTSHDRDLAAEVDALRERQRVIEAGLLELVGAMESTELRSPNFGVATR